MAVTEENKGEVAKLCPGMTADDALALGTSDMVNWPVQHLIMYRDNELGDQQHGALHAYADKASLIRLFWKMNYVEYILRGKREPQRDSMEEEVALRFDATPPAELRSRFPSSFPAVAPDEDAFVDTLTDGPARMRLYTRALLTSSSLMSFIELEM